MRQSIVRAALSFGVLLALMCLPFAVYADEASSDAMCNPVIPACPCGTVPSGKICVKGTNWYLCPDHCIDVEPGGTVFGHCEAPNKCHGDHAVDASGNAVPIAKAAQSTNILDSAMGFINKNPLVSGLAIGAGMSLLQSLFSGSGSSQPTSGSTNTGGVCTTQYYYTSDPTIIGVDPCALFSPGTSPTTNPTQTPTNPFCVAPIAPVCTSGTLVQQGLDFNGCPLAPLCQPLTTAGTSTNMCPSISITCPVGEVQQPQSGTDVNGCPLAPLCVSPTNNASSSCPATITSNCGIGFVSTQTGTDANGCAIISCVASATTPGSQCPAVTTPECTLDETLQQNGSDISGCPLSPTCVPNATSTQGTFDSGPTPVPINDILNTTVYYDNTTGPGTPDASSTPLNQPPQPIPEGLHGDISTLGGGATIYATSVAGNTEVAGFYGSNSTVGQLCAGRPWSSNFLSYIIPPAFFDNLCSWAGYPVGAVQNAGTATTGGVQNISVQGPSGAQNPYQAPSQSSAKIWAQPSSVSLGGRTTIFWTSQGVTSCVEFSSDGNFSGSSTSGGASTVALSGPVTFTIQCNTIDGQQITDSATVGIGI